MTAIGRYRPPRTLRGTPENSGGEAATFPKGLDTTNKEESLWSLSSMLFPAGSSQHNRELCVVARSVVNRAGGVG